MAGYHLTEIPVGEYGELTKIIEELQELIDADEQGAKLMVLQELSDLIGAIDGYLLKHFNGQFSIADLEKMASITKRAFESGARKAKE
jgi:hypothetical protein